MKIYCINTSKYVTIKGGDSLKDIYSSIAGELDFTPICAKVNNKTEGLGFPVFGPKMVEFLPVTAPSAMRVYTRSLCMLLYRATYECFPGSRLVMEHSISRGTYCCLRNAGEMTPEKVAVIKEKMQQLVDRALPLTRKERLRTDVIEIFRKQGLEDKVKLLESIHDIYAVYYTLDGVSDCYYGALVPNTSMLNVFDLQPYKEGLLLLGPDKENPTKPVAPIQQEKMFGAFTDYLKFNNVIGIENVGELNQVIEAGNAPMLINVAEALHEKKIAAIADDITERYHKGGARIVLIAGPSSSGKTTTIKRLAIFLATNLLKPRMISLDNYFVNRVDTPRDETGDYDYESLYALDLPLFNEHLNTLLDGGEVSLPTYNFETGSRTYKGDKIHLDDNSILLIEGIHGLNPQLTAQIEEKMKYRVYVSALTTLNIDDHNWVPTTDNRLLRRIIRDYKYRGTSAVDTIRRWPSVRRGEEKWIFPYQENADAMFNSSLLFELSVLREYGFEVLKNVPNDAPEYSEAYRLLRFLNYFAPLKPDAIPPTSLLREFLGGSTFTY